LTRYHPPIRRLQEDFARRLAHQRMAARRGPRPPSTITDNSVPWMEKPNSVADCIEISRRVAESEAQWRERFKISSTT
jgi:hypothetical protein